MGGKKFQFSLDSVLKLRAHETECARQDLASIRHEIQQHEQALGEAEDALRKAVDARKTGPTGQRSLARHEGFRQAAFERVQRERRQLEHLKQREEDAHLTLLKRKGAEESIRNLEEQERDSFRKELRSAETEQLDEQAITGYQRQRRAANQ